MTQGLCLLTLSAFAALTLSACTSTQHTSDRAPQSTGTGSIGSGNGPVPRFVFTHTSVNNKDKCTYSETVEPDGQVRGCTYECNGPVEGVSTTLLTCGDWDNLTVNISGRRYSTWKHMTSVGNFAGIGNNKGIVEWVGQPQGRGQANPTGLIVRFSGSRNETTVSRLVVFGIERDILCYKGTATDNVGARRIAISQPCIETIPPERN